MRKITLVFLIIVVILLSSVVTAWGINGTYKGFPTVNVVVNGNPVKSDVPAIVVDGRTLIPLRFIVEELGYKIDYNTKTLTVNIKSAESDNVKKLSFSDLKEAEDLLINGKFLCKTYSTPDGRRVVDGDALKEIANKLGLTVTIKSNKYIISNDKISKTYYYEALIDNKPYVAYAAIIMTNKYLGNNEYKIFTDR